MKQAQLGWQQLSQYKTAGVIKPCLLKHKKYGAIKALTGHGHSKREQHFFG
jgi:hypothetical protein